MWINYTAVILFLTTEQTGKTYQQYYSGHYINPFHRLTAKQLYSGFLHFFLYFWTRAGHFRYFWIFSIIKNYFFAFFIKLIWLGVGFLNRTGAEIGYYFDKKCNKSFFYNWKHSKIPKVPSSVNFSTFRMIAMPNSHLVLHKETLKQNFEKQKSIQQLNKTN